MQKTIESHPFYKIIAAIISIIAFLFAAYGIFVSLFNPAFDGTPAATRKFSSTPGESSGWYELYFTKPQCRFRNHYWGGLDTLIADDILKAQSQIDIVAYDLESEPIIDALIKQHRQSKIVRVVTDTDNSTLPSINRLLRNNIPVITDNRSSLMHNKFIVIDGITVYTGSLNFTDNGVYCNNNNLIRINNSNIAENYTAEVNEMADDGKFGPTSPENTPYQQLTIDSSDIRNYFSSETKVAAIIAEEVAKANEEILFMAYSFTEDQIGETMMARAADGVSLQGVFDVTGSSNAHSYYAPMRASKLPNIQVWQDGNKYAMHHKVIIIDQETVIFGSFNFSESANNNNDENILIVKDKEFATYFVQEFESVKKEAKRKWIRDIFN